MYNTYCTSCYQFDLKHLAKTGYNVYIKLTFYMTVYAMMLYMVSHSVSIVERLWILKVVDCFLCHLRFDYFIHLFVLCHSEMVLPVSYYTWRNTFKVRCWPSKSSIGKFRGKCHLMYKDNSTIWYFHTRAITWYFFFFFWCWRYLTRGLIWHLSQSSIRPSIYFSLIVKSRSNPLQEPTSTKQ